MELNRSRQEQSCCLFNMILCSEELASWWSLMVTQISASCTVSAWKRDIEREMGVKGEKKRVRHSSGSVFIKGILVLSFCGTQWVASLSVKVEKQWRSCVRDALLEWMRKEKARLPAGWEAPSMACSAHCFQPLNFTWQNLNPSPGLLIKNQKADLWEQLSEKNLPSGLTRRTHEGQLSWCGCQCKGET